MQYISTVTSKGQVLIPGEVRKKLSIKPLDRVIFRVDGATMVAERAPSINSMYGVIKPKKRLSDVELEKKIMSSVEIGLSEEK